MRRLVFTSAVVAMLVSVASAAAHVELTPERVAPGSAHLLEFSTPNEEESVQVVGLVVRLPKGLILDQLKARPGWQARIEGRTVTWKGGRILPRQFAVFALLATAPRREGTLTFQVRELLSDGSAKRYHPTLEVAAGAAASTGGGTPGKDSGARTLGTFALGIAIGGLGLAVLLGFGLLALWMAAPWEKDQKTTRSERHS